MTTTETEAPDELTAALNKIRADLSDGAAYPHRVMEIHTPRLLAAMDEVLKLHKPRRRHDALGGLVVCDAEVTGTPWPCQTHRAVSRALLGETAATTGEVK